MAFTKSGDGTRIHYELFGRRHGEPLLLRPRARRRQPGLDHAAPGARVAATAASPSTTGGSGSSDKPPGPYDLEVMADDALRGARRRRVRLGPRASACRWAGSWPRSSACGHPERVRSLVLACTACRHLPWRRELLERVDRDGRGPAACGAFVRDNMRWLVGPRSLRRIWPLRARCSARWRSTCRPTASSPRSGRSSPWTTRSADAARRRSRAHARDRRQPGHAHAPGRLRGAGRAHPRRRAGGDPRRRPPVHGRARRAPSTASCSSFLDRHGRRADPPDARSPARAPSA